MELECKWLKRHWKCSWLMCVGVSKKDLKCENTISILYWRHWVFYFPTYGSSLWIWRRSWARLSWARLVAGWGVVLVHFLPLSRHFPLPSLFGGGRRRWGRGCRWGNWGGLGHRHAPRRGSRRRGRPWVDGGRRWSLPRLGGRGVTGGWTVAGQGDFPTENVSQKWWVNSAKSNVCVIGF